MRLRDSKFLLLWQTLILLFLIAMSSAQSFSQCNGCPALETSHLDLKDCIHFRHPNKQYVIKNEATMQSLVRHDMSREKCLAQLKDIDFNKHTLVGTELNTGWCEAPLFTYQAFEDEAKKRYLLSVIYQPPETPCRALSQYDFWVLVPKLPEEYEVVFKVKAALPKK